MAHERQYYWHVVEVPNPVQDGSMKVGRIMTTATATRNGKGHALRNWILTGLGTTAALGLITFGIVYGAEKNSRGSTGVTDAQPGALAVQVEAHATDVRDHAERMIEIGQAESQDLWIEQGTNLLTEARRLDAIAAQIRAIENDKGILRGGPGIDIYRLRADGRSLEEAGQMLVDHGGAFASTADEMITQAQALGSTTLEDSAMLMKASANGMISDGRSVMAAAQPLLNEADQLERSLGR